MPEQILLRGGRVLCPETGTDDVLDVRIADGAVAEVGEGLAAGGAREVDCSGSIVAPRQERQVASPRWWPALPQTRWWTRRQSLRM